MASDPRQVEMSLAEPSGEHWRVERGFVAEPAAVEAGYQALLLKGLSRYGIIKAARNRNVWENMRYSVLEVSAPALAASGHAAQFSELLEIYSKTSETVGNESGVFYLDFHERIATILPRSPKINPKADRTLSVGLVGRAEAFIQDPIGGSAPTVLNSGDALHFDFRGVPEDKQPSHTVMSASVRKRISLISEATPTN